MNIPLLDLRAQFQSIRGEVLPALLEIVERQQFILGPPVSALEAAIAERCHSGFGIGCASGTDALLLSLRALDVGPGAEVITSPFTFFASAGSIHNVGARPVFVDIDPATFLLDLGEVETLISDRTRAIIPVHLFGQMAQMERVTALAERHHLAVVEDAAQAIGARQRVQAKWRMAGELGSTGAFSFFPSKNLGGWGDGGMIVTRDAALAGRLKRLRTHGGAKTYHHDEVGFNSRLDGLQAAVLLAKLPHLDAWAEARRARAAIYDDALSDVAEVVVPTTEPSNEHVYHQYTIRAERRDDLRAHLDGAAIGCNVYYPVPLHLQPCFAGLGYTVGRFPEAERASREVLSLPIYPELGEDDCLRVAETIRGFYQ